MTKIIKAIIITVLISSLTNAQVSKGEFVNVSIGYGLSAPYDEVDTSIIGTGLYLHGEYVFNLNKWFGLRPYAGVILTKTKESSIQENQAEYKVTSNAFLVGAKARITAPIPWVAPYLELGIGASLGSFETFTPLVNLKKKGLLTHIPVTIGLALGPKHNINFEFTYYYHGAVEQFAGAVALGLTFPMNNN